MSSGKSRPFVSASMCYELAYVNTIGIKHVESYFVSKEHTDIMILSETKCKLCRFPYLFVKK